MHTLFDSTPAQRHAPTAAVHLALDEAALEAARAQATNAPTLASEGPWRDGLVRMLNGALATELVCVLRYKRHHFTAAGLASSTIAQEFLVHANEEAAHADRLARRIVQLGGEPDFAPDSLTARSHADYDASTDLRAMIRANLVAERVAIEAYSQMVRLIGDTDPTTRRLVEDILADEQNHAEELSGWLTE